MNLVQYFARNSQNSCASGGACGDGVRERPYRGVRGCGGVLSRHICSAQVLGGGETGDVVGGCVCVRGGDDRSTTILGDVSAVQHRKSDI